MAYQIALKPLLSSPSLLETRDCETDLANVSRKSASAAILLGCTTVFGSASVAQSAQSQFSLRLVIEPDCRNPENPTGSADPVAAEDSDAIGIALRYLRTQAGFRHLVARGLTAEHDESDTGNWLVRARGIEKPILRVEKCSGDVISLLSA